MLPQSAQRHTGKALPRNRPTLLRTDTTSGTPVRNEAVQQTLQITTGFNVRALTLCAFIRSVFRKNDARYLPERRGRLVMPVEDVPTERAQHHLGQRRLEQRRGGRPARLDELFRLVDARLDGTAVL